MAVIAIKKRFEREGSGESQRNNLLYEVVGRRYHVEYDVFTTTHKDGSNVVLNAPGVPKIGDVYVFGNDADAVATCIRTRAKATANPKIWRVEAEYDTDRIVSMITDNPLNQPPEISWDYSQYDRPLYRDVLGVPLVSSSGNAFDPVQTVEDARPILHITRNEASFDHSIALPYQYMLNSDVFAGALPLYARINHITGHRQLSNGILFYSCDYEIEFRPKESFVLPILDQDFRDLDGKLFLDIVTAAPLANETLLNGRGRSMFKSKTKLQNALSNDPTDTSVTIYGGDIQLFPPGPRPALADGIVPGPHGKFNIKIGDEVMTVTAGYNTAAFIVERATGGSIIAAHSVDDVISLEPYFLRFIPHKYGRFAPLVLPVV